VALRRAPLIVAVACVVFLMSGCHGEPVPVKTTPLFASEEEAFAAAEETYRAYVDALNQVDLSDPETFEPVFALTTGEFQTSERKSFSEMSANRWSVGGESSVRRVDPVSYTESGDPAIVLGSCLDVSAVTLVDASGSSLVDPTRPNVQSTHITFVHARSTEHGVLISDIVGADLEPPCEQ